MIMMAALVSVYYIAYKLVARQILVYVYIFLPHVYFLNRRN
jgi:hypothetical protein